MTQRHFTSKIIKVFRYVWEVVCWLSLLFASQAIRLSEWGQNQEVFLNGTVHAKGPSLFHQEP